ncbi:uncharacterized protein LOC117647098 [Thrips palmi]|uniref:Uncharacterized protein LOC117647098 n=1 Tax=Thrips palmi TaxID=161013 RepID=A0A6P8YWK8_THRPL|nr:uncharacterized protein LOC117647098 [Thrips palmi]
MECSVCLEVPEKRIPQRHLNATCRPRHIYATFVGACSCAIVWCVWCARKASDYRLKQAINSPAAAESDDDQVEMVPCPMCRAAVHPTRFITHPKPLSPAERARLVREYKPPPCWFIWGSNVCRFGRLCRNSHAGIDGRPVQCGKPLSKEEWLARLPEPFYMPPSFLDRDGRAWYYTERHGYVHIVDPHSPQVWEKLDTAARFSPMSDKHPRDLFGFGGATSGAVASGADVGGAVPRAQHSQHQRDNETWRWVT